jgi:peptidylprolyl isomerase
MTILNLVLLFALVLGLNAAQMSTKDGLDYLEANRKKTGVISTPSGLQYKIISQSKNSHALSPNASTNCHVHYRGTTIKGFEFDSSYKRGKPSQFSPQNVIQGWKEALMKMKEGDKWQLVIPAEMAYGKRSMGEYITPGSVLVFEVELVKVDADGSGLTANLIPQFLKRIPLAIWIFVAYFVYQLFLSPETDGSNMRTKIPLNDVIKNKHNDIVFMDVKVGDKSAERIEFELFTKMCPLTCANFLHLCLGDKGKSKFSGKELTYKGSPFHRVIPGFMVQGGDFTLGNGRGGESIYGTKFEDEWTNGYVPHEVPYLLSMANAGKNTNGSQFFITLAATSWLDQKHVVFGKVISGLKHVECIRDVGSSSGRTHSEVTVIDCGVVKRGVPIPAPSPTPAPAPIIKEENKPKPFKIKKED